MTPRIEAGPAPVAACRGGRRALVGWLFIGPVIFGVIAFQFVPVMVSLYASLTDWTGLSPPEFTGFGNYGELLTRDPLFWLTLKNTLVFTVGSLVFSIAFGLVLALLCNQKVPGISLFPPAHLELAVAGTQNGVNENFSQHIQQARAIYRPQLDLIYSGQKSAADALGEVKDRVEQALASGSG